MAHLWTPSNLTARFADGRLTASETGYGFGLRVTSDCRFEHIVAHGGGLPGFGSYMAWLPDYGVGMFAMATLTYSGPSEPMAARGTRSWRRAAAARELPPTARQTEMRDHFAACGSLGRCPGAADCGGQLLPRQAVGRAATRSGVKDQNGTSTSAGPVMPENWMRGQFNLTCAKGTVGVFFTMAPTQPPTVQHLAFRKPASPDERMGAPTGAPAGVSCRW